MAMTCARCGAQNPDGNLYCQVCGTPLTAPSRVATPAPPAAPPGPPPGVIQGPPPNIAPPTPGPAGYQSPYYAPTGPVAPIHRTPWMLIVAAVVALVVLMAGCGTALAILGSRGSPSTSGTTITDVPSPSPATTPSPVASPIPSPSTNPSGVATESNDGVTMTVPAGWSVASRDSEAIVLTDPNGEGSVTAASGSSSPVQTAGDNKNTIEAYFKSNYPDTRLCPGSSVVSSTFNGARGFSWSLCFTLTSGGHSIPAAASLFAGANTSGSVYYVVMVITRQDNLKAYVTVAKPVLSGIKWKLS
ncbi:MAG TPA: zinc-ribbon domain-containing protein [Candidatus Dormibacteraeota bacterium]